MRLFKVLIMVASLAVAAAAQAQRTPVPIVERDVNATTASGRVLDAATLREAVMAAGQRRQWRMVVGPDGSSVRGTFSWNNNKHTIVVQIQPTATGYTVKYVDSINMKYAVENSVPVIHPFYYRHVDQLIDSVRVELGAL